ncbi:GntR family transcriptional regulator [Oceanobacillus senegalensis]|uniref:GntR family transcriptional regulator n=1 Tax=Oceanobacillus senegalensis TaxID=1936063 RepID=UPI000A305B4C|nr:GntR family transcriptional regulator [Oceanobacillus senegalensis]
MAEKLDLRIGNREMLHSRVCSILRRAILKGDFTPGERLVQAELADLIGVSRMPVREALRTLELEGLVKIEPHKGAVVRTIQKQDIQEIYELRILLEPVALKKSIQYFTENDFKQLSLLHQEMVSASTGESYVELNVKFHNLLFSRCNSPRLLGFIETISHGFAQDTPQLIPGQIQKSNKEHEAIMESIYQGDVEKAGEYLAKHIERTGKELIASMENNDFQ